MFSLSYTEGDLSNPPKTSIVVHACNCHGQLGAGVALAMKKAFPQAHGIYSKKCSDAEYGEQLRGECFLIRPQVSDAKTEEAEKEKECWIGCLLTSHGYGSQTRKTGSNPHPRKDDAEMILANTRKALQSLRRQIEETFEEREWGYPAVYSSRINAKNFGVPWSESEALIKEVFEGMGVEWTVVDLHK